jgi:hypothetical protein
MCALFAATYPARTSALITAGSYARRTWAPDYPWAVTPEQHRQFMEHCQREWGGPVGLDELWRRQTSASASGGKLLRMGASPAANLALLQMNAEMDVRHVLPAIRVPALILHSAGDRALPVAGSRFMAEQIPGARFVELAGVDHVPWGADADAILDEIEEFLTGVRHGPEPDRVLATVLFTDIVGSTEKAGLGIGAGETPRGHHDVVRRELADRGRRSTAGDGFLPLRRARARRPLRARHERRRPRPRARDTRGAPYRRGRAPR